MESFSERALREREQYNQGLKRRSYNAVFSHTKHFYRLRREQILREQLQYANGRGFSNCGSHCWIPWIDNVRHPACFLECINISEKERERQQRGHDISGEAEVLLDGR